MSTPSLVKQPSESRLFSMEFAAMLASGETITSVDSVTADKAGLTFTGAPAANGTKALQRIAGGTSGVAYKVTMKVTTNAGNVLEGEGLLQVKDL